MQIELTSDAKEHLLYWQKTGNKSILKKIEKLTDSILETPYSGIGKPEALRFGLSGKWSRRITDEHRYIYDIFNNTLRIYSLRGHYI